MQKSEKSSSPTWQSQQKDNDDDGSMTAMKYIRSSRNIMFRLLKQPALTDVVLICGSATLPAHRILLAACSPYLKEMLIKEETSGNRPFRLTFPDIDPSTAEILLEFAYTGRLNVASKNFTAVSAALEAAQHLQVGALYRKCVDVLTETLTANNVIEVWELGERCRDLDLAEKSLDLLARQLETRYKSSRYLSLPFDKFTSIVIRATRACQVKNSVGSMIRAALTWAKHDPKSRGDHLGDIFRCIQDSSSGSFWLTPAQNCDSASKIDTVSANGTTTDHPNPASEDPPKAASEDPPNPASEDPPNPASEDPPNPASEDPPKAASEASSLVADEQPIPYLLIISVSRSDRIVLELFDLMDDQWLAHREQCPTTTLLRGAAVVCLKNTIFFFGGETKSGDKVATCVSMKEFQTIQLAPMKFAKAHAGAGLLEAMLYCVGGQNKYSASLNCVERYCPNHNMWKVVAPLQNPRSNVSVASANGHLFAFGGMNCNAWVNTCEMYDPEANEWTDIAMLPSVLSNTPLKTTAQDDRIYLIRGQRPTFAAHLSLEKNAWIIPKSYTGCAPPNPQIAMAYGDQVFVVDDKKAIYVYYLQSHTWEKISKCSSINNCKLIFATFVSRQSTFDGFFREERLKPTSTKPIINSRT